MTVRIYTHPKMSHTIFHDKDTRNVLFRSGVEFVNFPEQADVLIGNCESLVQDFITKFAASKRYLLGTHEPLFWTSAAKWATISGQRGRTMSLHLRRCLPRPFCLRFHQITPGLSLLPEKLSIERSRL